MSLAVDLFTLAMDAARDRECTKQEIDEVLISHGLDCLVNVDQEIANLERLVLESQSVHGDLSGVEMLVDEQQGSMKHHGRQYTKGAPEMSTERHPQSDTLDRIHRHFGGAADLPSVAEVIGVLDVEEWQLAAPVGAYMVSILPPLGDGMFVTYMQICERDEIGLRKLGIKRGSFDWHYRKCVNLIENGFEPDFNAWRPHDFHCQLSESEFKYLLSIGLPNSIPGFLNGLAEFHRNNTQPIQNAA